MTRQLLTSDDNFRYFKHFNVSNLAEPLDTCVAGMAS